MKRNHYAIDDDDQPQVWPESEWLYHRGIWIVLALVAVILGELVWLFR